MSCQLAKVFLVQPADLALRVRETVISLHQQIAPFTGYADRSFGRFQSTCPCKGKTSLNE